MHVTADFSIVPLGVGISLSPYVAACEDVLEESGLSFKLHAFGTNVEGDWDAVFQALRRCLDKVHEMGAQRITTSVRIGTRTDRPQTLDEKVSSVQKKRERAGSEDG